MTLLAIPVFSQADLRMVKVRRRMLSLHQILGLTTVASMTATVIGGQLALDGHGFGLHKASLPRTIGLYSSTAVLALSAPPRLIRGGGIDTITFYKAFAVLHLAWMILTPMLAPELDEGGGNANLHQALGLGDAGMSVGVRYLTDGRLRSRRHGF